MFEQEQGRKFDRRRFLSMTTRGALGVGVALAIGGVDDQNPNIESLDNVLQITPIYGTHNTGYADSVEAYNFSRQLNATGVLPDIHIWPEETKKELVAARPSIVAVDSLSYTSLGVAGNSFDASDWYSFPQNPYTLKKSGDLSIVAADMPFAVLDNYQKYPTLFLKDKSTETLAVLDGIRTHYENLIGDEINSDINYPVVQKDLDKFLKETKVEAAVSNFGVGIGPLLYMGGESAWRRKPISRRKFAKGTALSALGFGNATRLFGGYIADDYSSANSYYFAPISSIPEIANHVTSIIPHLVFRNSLIAIKLNEAEKALKSPTPLKKVAVMGTAHSFGKTVWFNSNIQEQTIRNMFEEIFKSVEKQNIEGMDRNALVDKVAEFFGGVAMWNVGDEPESLTLKAVQNSIVPTTSFTSPTIERLAHEAAQKSGFAV